MDELLTAESIAKYSPRLVRIVWGRGIPPQDCEDVAQEAITDALRQLRQGNFRGESKPETWLVKILYGKIADYWRRQRREAHLVSLTADPPEALPAGRLPSLLSTAQPDHSLVLNVRDVLRQLAPRKRLILILHKSQGWTIKEIAQRFGWKPGTVGRQLAEAEQEFCELIIRK